MQWQTDSNYPNAPNQPAKFSRSIRLISPIRLSRFVLIGWLFLFMVGCAQSPQIPGISTSLVIPTPTIIVSEDITSTSSKPTYTPTTLPSPSPILIDLHLGDVNRGMNCPFITEVVLLVLERELNLNISVTHFDSADNLFDALNQREIDLTLCYIDPDDRTRMKDHLGHIRQIGSTYWSDEQGKLQIWANGSSKSYLRDEMSCVLHFFEDLKITDITSNITPQQWVQNHIDQVQTWMSCVPSNN